MKAHTIKEEQNRIIKEELTKQLDKARNIGIEIGIKTVSKVIYDKAMAKEKTDSEKLADIITLCKVGLVRKNND